MRNAIGTAASASTAIIRACPGFTGRSSRYSASTRKMKIVCPIRWLTMPLRNSASAAMMLPAVAAASPGTTRTEGT